MLGLLMVVQAAGFWVVRVTLEQQARAELSASLVAGERIWTQLISQNVDRLRQAAGVLSTDFGFRAAITSGDVETIASALDNSGERIGAGLVALLSPRYQLVASGQKVSVSSQQQLQVLAAELAADRDNGRVALVEGVPHQFVMVPVRAPVLVGWVLMGFPMTQSLLGDMRHLSRSDVTVLVGAEPGAWRLAMTTYAGAGVAALAQRVEGADRFELDGGVWVTHPINMGALGSPVQVVLMRSFDEAMQSARDLQLALGVITMVGVILFALGSQFAARRVTQPLADLKGVTQAIEAGDYTVEVAGTDRGDEVGALARGFDQMRGSIAAQREEILRLAYWDRLTGLPNRARFREVLQAAIDGSRQVAKPLVVITLNLDRFKHVNDVLGYALGDELLKAVAARLRAQVFREGDLVARMGGDEFAILLSRADAEGAVVLTERIVKAFESPLAFEDQTVDLSASMGVACWPTDAPDADLLMSRSEIAMHAAKSRTTGVLLYSPALDSSSAQTLSLLTELRHALQNHELRLFLQPKVATDTRRVVAAEALVRWQHPQRGLVPPLQFIPFAEQTGFVRQLTLWIFEEVARQWAGLQSPGEHLRIAINLSTRDLLDIDFPGRLATLMQTYGLQAQAFCLEITESAIMDDPQRAEATLNKLAAQGFKLSIDDFGTGYSSLAYLKRLPVNELKIDKSFVMGMETDQSDAKIVRSTIDLAHNLGLTVVAEGVENAAILDQLRDLQCDEAQGYFVSKPMPAADFPNWRQQWYHPA
jgi:diguanylate cyclase (GGDEF)-like protein